MGRRVSRTIVSAFVAAAGVLLASTAYAQSLTGDYVFTGLVDEEQQAISLARLAFRDSALDFRDIQVGSTVSIVQSDQTAIDVSYVSVEGAPKTARIDLSSSAYAWREGELVYHAPQRKSGPVILPGPNRKREGYRLGVTTSGDLKVTMFVGEEGLVVFAIPYRDNGEKSVVLPRKDS